MLTTRPATFHDEPRGLALLGQLLGRDISTEPGRARSFRRMLAEPVRGMVLVAEEEGQVLGVISFSYNLAIRFDTCYAQIEELVVDAAARGKQAGAVLVRAAMEEARGHGCEEMGLYPREETRAFYERLGFAYVGVGLRQRLR